MGYSHTTPITTRKAWLTTLKSTDPQVRSSIIAMPLPQSRYHRLVSEIRLLTRLVT